MRSTMKFSTIFLLAILGLFAASCTGSKQNKEHANYIHEVIKSNVKGFDPVISGDLYSGIVMSQIYDGLLQYTYLQRPITVEPALADGMPQISKDGKVYTFKIKKGVFFHDDPAFKATGGKGRELEAEDFIYSWKRLADASNHSDGFWIFDGKIKGISEWREEATKAGKADYTKPISGLKAVDKYTLRIELVKPFPQILYVLTMAPSFVVPHEGIETYDKEFLNHPIGTGPYKFKSWTRNAKIVLEKNPNYRDDFYPTKGEAGDQEKGMLADAGKKLPLNDGVIFEEMVEDQPRFLNFKKGTYDYAEIPKDNFDSSVKGDQIVDELKNKGIELTKWTDPDVTFHSYNMDDPVIGGAKGKLIRQAMSLAQDQQDIIQKFYNGRAIPAHGPIPPGISGFDPKRVNPYNTHNLEKAKELLKKAGYPEGKGLPELTYEIYSGSTARQLAEHFQQTVAKIGIKVKINTNTWPEFLAKQKARKSQMFGMAWSADYPDAENFLQLFYGKNASPGPNNSNYNNPEFNKLYEQASVLQDTPERNKIYQKMVDIVVEDEPWSFAAHRLGYVLNHGWFKNYKRSMIILNYDKYYRIDQEAKAKLQPKL